MTLLNNLTLAALTALALPAAQATPWPAQPIDAQYLAETFTNRVLWQNFDWSVAQQTKLWREPGMYVSLAGVVGPTLRSDYVDLGDVRYSTRFAVSFLRQGHPSAKLLAFTHTEDAACEHQAEILSTAYGAQPALVPGQTIATQRTWHLGRTQVVMSCYPPSGSFTVLEIRFEAAGEAVATR